MQNKISQLFSLKKIVLFLIMAEMLNLSVMANPGDTTWVTVYNLQKLTHYGNYDTSAVFPTGKRYRKIRLHYILGRYACAPGSQYCGSWDYTTQIYARPAGKDSVEIARIITPYATDWLSLNKTHEYIVEVTDYATALDGPTAMRFGYQGYSWGFTITLKIEFIEGVPPMDALSVKNIYDGYFPFGNASNTIENYLIAKPFSYNTKAFIKNTVSGHGSDNQGCSEFCSKYYVLKINSNVVSQKQIWRSTCGINEVYPQTGTWIYQRGGWCPGAVVWPIYHDLGSITSPNSTFTVDIDMQPYVGSGSLGGYNFVTHLINYSTPNFSKDVSIEDIISPTTDDNYFRENPVCSNPVIKIKNTGTDSLKQVIFNYGLAGGPPLTYTWTGSLGFLKDTVVVFPPSTSILTGTVSSVFQVSVVSVNGTTGDQNLFNNIYNSVTTPVVIFPQNFVVKMLTNHSTDGNTGYNETTWTLYDQTGAIVMQWDTLNSNTAYIDTLNLAPGCYRISVDDSGCDGMSFWNNTAGGTGTLRFDYANANNTIFSFPGDFGCNFTKNFVIIDEHPNYTGIKSNAPSPNLVEVYPNPAGSIAYIKFDLNQSQTVNYKLMDINGRIIQQKTLSKITAAYENVDLSQVSNGVYFVSIELQDKSVITKKLVIQK
jgi:hypothetical protein